MTLHNSRSRIVASAAGLLLLAALLYAAQSQVQIRTDEDYRYIDSNGIPDHGTGTFPNRDNPNTISEQRHHFRMPVRPQRTGHSTPLGMNPFGVAINGVPFDPGAAEYWNNNPQSGWQYEALSDFVQLGLDQHHAHVQPSGAYHYHGMPTGLTATLLGYAADGFPIYRETVADSTARSSYQLKTGTRPNGPGGTYDGRFVQDYAYVADSGDLDPCNGREGITPEYPNGTYYYVITTTFPFIPRCFVGIPDASFQRGSGPPPMRGTPPSGHQSQDHPSGPPPHNRRPPPPGAPHPPR